MPERVDTRVFNERPAGVLSTRDDKLYNPDRVYEISGSVAAYTADTVCDLRGDTNTKARGKAGCWWDPSVDNISSTSYDDREKHDVDTTSGWGNLNPLSGNNAPTLHGPVPISFVIENDDPTPSMALRLKDSNFNNQYVMSPGSTARLYAYLTTASTEDTIVTVAPHPGVSARKHHAPSRGGAVRAPEG